MSAKEIKNTIQNRFNKAALTYDDHSIVQKKILHLTIDLLLKEKNTFQNIANIACGTGECMLALRDNINYLHCYALDLSEKMLTVAKNKCKNDYRIQWIHADFEQQDWLTSELDLIFCNMGLQWSLHLDKTLILWQNYLHKNGLLVFSVPLHNNFPELYSQVKPEFISHRKIVSILRNNGYKILEYHLESIIEKFPNQMSALKALKATGTNGDKKAGRVHYGLKRIDLNNIFIEPQCNQLTYKIGIYLAKRLYE